jgi:hypothetical protein
LVITLVHCLASLINYRTTINTVTDKTALLDKVLEHLGSRDVIVCWNKVACLGNGHEGKVLTFVPVAADRLTTRDS